MMEKENKILKYVFFTFSILSILTASIWYLTAIFGISSLIYSIKATKKYATKTNKVTTVLSIIGLTLMLFIYISLVMIMIVMY